MSDSAGVSLATSIVSDAAPTGDATGSLRVGSLDGESGIPLYGVNGASLLEDGRIAVLNRGTSEVLVISPTGDLLSRFGREGDGPSEFKNLWSVHVRPPDTLVVGDYRPRRLGRPHVGCPALRRRRSVSRAKSRETRRVSVRFEHVRVPERTNSS